MAIKKDIIIKCMLGKLLMSHQQIILVMLICKCNYNINQYQVMQNKNQSLSPALIRKKKLQIKKEQASRQSTINFRVRFLKIVPQLLKYCLKETKRRKSRQQHQNLLFPFKKQTIKPQFDIKSELLKEYTSVSYQWYLSQCGLFIEDQYLNIMKESTPLYKNIFGDTFGQIVCVNDNQRYKEDQKGWLIFGTQKSFVVVFQHNSKKIQSIYLPSHKQQRISSVKILNGKIFIFSETICSVVALHDSTQQKLKLIVSKKLSTSIKFPQIVLHQKIIYIFWLNQKNLYRSSFQTGIISSFRGQEILLTTKNKHFYPTNFKVSSSQSSQKCIIIVTTIAEAYIYSHHFQRTTANLIKEILNCKNPYSEIKKFNHNCIQCLWMQQNKDPEEVEVMAFYTDNDRLIPLKIYVQSQLCIVGKRTRFLNTITSLKAMTSEVIRIVLVQNKYEFNHNNDVSWPLSPQGQVPNTRIYTIFLTLIQKIYEFKFMQNVQNVQKFEYQIKQKISYNEGLSPKNVLKCQFINYLSPQGKKQILLIKKNTNKIERIILRDWKDLYKDLRRTENIKLLYFLILLRNIQSPFLSSPTLDQYQSHTLENCIPLNTQQNKLILLEYYYLIGLSPIKIINIKEQPQLMIPFIINHKISNLESQLIQWLVIYWQKKDLRLVEEMIVGGAQFGWDLAVRKGWVRALRKMVEMGSQIDLPVLKLYSFIVAEQEIEKNKKKQVNNSVNQLNLNELIPENNPLFAFFQAVPDEKEDTSYEKIKTYCYQIIQYSKLAFSYIMKLEQFSESLQLFYKVFLHQKFFQLLVIYQPIKIIKMTSTLFLPCSKAQEIDKFNMNDFFHCSRQFEDLVAIKGYSVSQMIISHISATFLYFWGYQGKAYTIFKDKIEKHNQKLNENEQSQFLDPILAKQKLIVHHAKLLDKGIFNFKTSYIKQMIFCLVKDNNKYLKKVMKLDEELKLSSYEHLQVTMQDFLVRIWNRIVKEQSVDEIKGILAEIQLLNNTNHYLLVVIMQCLNIQEYSVKILNKFLQIKTNNLQRRIFQWLYKVIEIIPSFSKQIIIHLKQLIQIDKKVAREFFGTYFANRQKQIISRIDNDPILQIEYVELIIDDHQQQSLELEDYYTTLHMKLLIQLQPERIIDVLNGSFIVNPSSNSIKYNIEEVLRMCKDTNKQGQQWFLQKRQILSYLYEKLGNIQSAIGCHLQLLQGYLRTIITMDQKEGSNEDENQKNDSEQQNENSQKQRISQIQKRKLSYFSQVIANKVSEGSRVYQIYQKKLQQNFNLIECLILRQPIKKYTYFYIFMNGFFAIMNRVSKSNYKKKRFYLEILSQQLGKLIVSVFERGYSGEIVKWLEGEPIETTQLDQDIPYTQQRSSSEIKISASFILSTMRNYIFSGYQKINSQIRLLESWERFGNQDLLNKIQQTVNNLNKGISSNPQCFVCQKNIELDQQKQEDALLFNCGHIFHRGCIEDSQQNQDYCWKCVSLSNIQSMIDFQNIQLVEILQKLKKKKNLAKLGNILKGVGIVAQNIKDFKSSFKKKMNRLSIYQKKQISLLNQCQIIDAKITILEYYAQSQDKY